ncbi:export ABC transporter ATP-binding protein [bacterium]|nr:MAG: export ABC transporter ATP-binding protein [bacterium]
MIDVVDLKKSYADVMALRGVSFSVKEGEIFGLLGPNGAGKTTTVSILSGVLEADSGSVSIAGIDIKRDSKRVKRLMGVVPQEIALYEELSAKENLHFWGGLYGLSGKDLERETERVLELVELTDRANDPVKSYSGGMKRRLNLIIGLIHRPRIILLDEPTLGIDPQARLKILDIVKGEAANGSTIVYTTHYLDEAEKLCDRIAIIDRGEILSIGTLAEIARLAGEEDMVTITGDFEGVAIDSLLEGARLEYISEGVCTFSVPERPVLGGILERFFKAGVKVRNIEVKEPSLEGAFVKLTGRELRDM